MISRHFVRCGAATGFTPALTIINRIHHDTVAVLADAGVKEKLEQLGITAFGATPQELARYPEAEKDKWGRL